MPSTFVIDATNRVVISHAAGSFTSPEYFDHVVRLLVHPGFDPSFSHLVDCREVASLEVDAEDIQRMAGVTAFDIHASHAFVAPVDSVFEMARSFATHRHNQVGQMVQVFRSLDEALHWLRLPASFDPGQV